MNRLPLSAAAAALFRALVARAAVDHDQILLSEAKSVEWHSLTLDGERHDFLLRLVGPGARAAARRLGDGLAEAEFTLSGWIVADIALISAPRVVGDGTVELAIEALTIRD